MTCFASLETKQEQVSAGLSKKHQTMPDAKQEAKQLKEIL